MTPDTKTQGLRIAMIAGEKSGDNLGAGFIKEFLARYPDTRFEGIGGPAMMGQGFESLFPMERLSVMGFIEPLARLPDLLSINRQLKSRWLESPPDLFIGIDSPGFNTQLEKFLRQNGIKTVHYVSPSVWAYGAGRINKIGQAVDLMLVLFPFETAIYRSHDIPVKCVGHPLADVLAEPLDRLSAREFCGLQSEGTVIALLPGSRFDEVKRLAPLFIEVAVQCEQRGFPLQFVLPCANENTREQIEGLLQHTAQKNLIRLLDGGAHQAIRAADLVLLASGTATLETLLLGRPMVICYKVAWLTHLLASRMLKVPYVGLPNLLAGELLVPEYLQQEATVNNLLLEVEQFLEYPERWQGQLQRFADIHAQLAKQADKRSVEAVLDLLELQGSLC